MAVRKACRTVQPPKQAGRDGARSSLGDRRRTRKRQAWTGLASTRAPFGGAKRIRGLSTVRLAVERVRGRAMVMTRMQE